MRDAWPISWRINSGFILLTLMLIGLVVFAHRSIGALGNGYTEYRDITQRSAAISAYMDNIYHARLAAFQYRENPDPALAEDVLSDIAKVTDDRSTLALFAGDAARLAEVTALIDLMAQYGTAFTEMTAEAEAAQATEQTVTQRFAQMHDGANALFRAAVTDGNPTSVAAAGRTLEAALGAVIQSDRFLLTSDPATKAAFEDSFGVFQQRLRQLIGFNPPPSVRAEAEALGAIASDLPALLDRYATADQRRRVIQDDVLDQIGPDVQERFHILAAAIAARQDALGPQGAAIVTKLQTGLPIVGSLTILVAILAAFVIGRWITRSITRLADLTDRLATGDDTIEITGTQHRHELGRMARALHVFREAEIARKTGAAEREEMRQQQDAVVQIMQTELAALADGNLTTQIEQSFAADYEELRSNFNAAVDALHLAMVKVVETARGISANATDTKAATNELSHRTENQASTLEETVAALNELTASVKSAAAHAKSADEAVTKARSEATRNGAVVAKAVDAMAEIESSSKQITQVVSVIDDIAFQTNLLALNAGVEAARAGETGKGFAVVAAEVRSLAQRSADAAKEISGLIANSSRHVQQGTQLVGNAGTALAAIIDQVNEIASMTSQIATSVDEQSTGLSEINVSVTQLDRVTQENAVMVQQSLSRGDALSREADTLNRLITRFQVAARDTPYVAPDAAAILATAVPDIPPDQPRFPPRKRAIGARDSMWEDF